MTTASPQSAPDILTVGPEDGARPSRRRMLAVLAAVAALTAGLVLWRVQPVPAPPFTLLDLQGVYAGMVRSDGSSDASVIERGKTAEESGYIAPEACEPLFEATVLNRVPKEALDGVGTFWALGRSAVSLFSYRFRDIAGANREYARLAEALGNCRDARVELHGRPAGTGLLKGIQQDPAGEPSAQLGYAVTSADGTKLAVHVLAFSNTVTWQFRYEPVPGPYAPLAAQRVMESLADQMRAVQDLRR